MIMATKNRREQWRTIAKKVGHPPTSDYRFWLVQLMVVFIALTHLYVDMNYNKLSGFPDGIPVALLILPVGYAALHFGLSGSAATGLWAGVLWLPDLLLPHDQGHAGSDVLSLILVEVVAFIVGQRVEAERETHSRVENATLERLLAEARYRQLFNANASPILVVDSHCGVRDINPAAKKIFGDDVVGASVEELLDTKCGLDMVKDTVVSPGDGKEYRVDLVAFGDSSGEELTQVVLEDVTAERRERLRIRKYAELVVEAEEEQRKQLSRELHDEPLQLFLHLARRLELLGETQGVPTEVVDALSETRNQALQAANSLRSMARSLRPPALDQLGLVPALSGLIADSEDQFNFKGSLRVLGTQVRLAQTLELVAFRVVQESINNTVRHANANNLSVEVEFSENWLRLTIADDGDGFDWKAVEGISEGHLGLLGMRERVTSIGGEVTIDSRLGEGTTVVAQIPIVRDAMAKLEVIEGAFKGI